MYHRWKDVPISASASIERIARADLPTLLGKNDSLDKRIARILGGGSQEDYFWISNDSYLITDGVTNILKEYAGDCDSAEIEIEALSSGFYDSGHISGPPEDCNPPEDDDERIIGSIAITFYEDGDEKSRIIIEKGEHIGEFESQFEEEIYKEELPASAYESDGSEIDYAYDRLKEKLL